MPAINDIDSRSTQIAKLNAAIAALEAIAKTNLTATAPPTATDDSSKSYAIGSTWLISGTGEMWRARDVTVGAARWVKVDTADFDMFVPGRYYLPFSVNGVPSSLSPSAANILRLFYGVIKQRVTIDQLGMRTTAAGGNAQLGIYRSIAGVPSGLPVAKTASIALPASAVYTSALDAGNVTLEPGPYWFASQLDTQTNCIVFGPGPVASTIIGSPTALDVLTGNAVQGLQLSSNAYGTWPDLTGVSVPPISGNGVTPIVAFRVASVP